jgi:heme exporter protein D
MQFDSLQSFVEMGGHGPYVWAAFGVWLIVVGGLCWQTVLARKQCQREIQRYLEEVDHE